MTINEIAQKIDNEGGTLYLVGGALRDRLLGKESNDEDYCVTGISGDKFKSLFPECFIRGKSFEVFELNGKEFAMARTEKKVGTGHKEFEINSNEKITIEEDLSRRDITVNSIAENVLTGEIIDPFNGREDIKKRLIRATTEKFKEDPLRVYRVARFAAKLNFKVDLNTINLMNSLKEELNTLSAERVFIEFEKALQTDNPSVFFEILKIADVLDVHFKEINDLIGVLQPIEHHPEGDAFKHTMLVLNYTSKETNDVIIRFAALVHDLGKGVTPKEEYPHHYNHEENGVKLVEQFGNRLKMPNKWISSGKTATREHMRGGIFYRMRPSKKVDFIERVDKSKLGLHGLQIVVNADKLSSKNQEAGDINFEKIGTECLNTITGKLIIEKYNTKPGIELKNKLREERIKWMTENN